MVGALAGALTLGLLAVPAAASAATDAAILNGIPTKIDLCIGKQEVASNVRFGRAVFWTDAPSKTHRFVVRKAAPGKCKGKKLGVVRATWADGQNQTSVIWKPFAALKVKTFTNDLSVPEGMATVRFRHTAKAPVPVDVWVWEQLRASVDEWPPTFDNVKKGSSSGILPFRPGQFSMDVLPARRSKAFGWAGWWTKTDPEKAWQFYLVGTSKKNYRLASLWWTGEVPPAP
jgi:hypothetical protein